MEVAVGEDRIAKPRFGIPRVVEGRVDRERRLRQIGSSATEVRDPPRSLERELNTHVLVREGVVRKAREDESPPERLRRARRKLELVLRPVGLARVDHVVRLALEHAARVRERPRVLRRARERTREQEKEGRFHDLNLRAGSTGRDTGSGYREVLIGEGAFHLVREWATGIDKLVCDDARA